MLRFKVLFVSVSINTEFYKKKKKAKVRGTNPLCHTRVR